MKDIKTIAILRNVIEYNSHHKRDYYCKKGVIIIEKIDNTRQILDLESMVDITNSDYIEVKLIRNKTKLKYLFKNVLYYH